jgi:hypothetical protein
MIYQVLSSADQAWRGIYLKAMISTMQFNAFGGAFGFNWSDFMNNVLQAQEDVSSIGITYECSNL